MRELIFGEWTQSVLETGDTPVFRAALI